MRAHTRLATTAGVTVLGFVAMSGVAQADTGGLNLGGLTGSVTNTVNGLLGRSAAKTPSRSPRPGLNVDLPLHAHLSVPGPSGGGNGGGKSGTGGSGDPSADVKAGVKLSTSPVHLDLALGLCAGLANECAAPPEQPIPNPPNPPAPPTPTPTPPSENPPSSSGSGAVVGSGSLPFTGGPIGSLALLGAVAVVTGAGGVAASRIRFRHES